MLLAQSVFFTGEELLQQFGLEPVYQPFDGSKLKRPSRETIPLEIAYFRHTVLGRQSTLSPDEALTLVEGYLRSNGIISPERPMIRRTIEATLVFGEPQVFTELGDREKDQPMIFNLVMHFSF